MSLCDTCILNGKCDGRCGDTDPTYYDFEAENDLRDEYETMDPIEFLEEALLND